MFKLHTSFFEYLISILSVHAHSQVDQARLVTAVSGFPKAKSGYNIDNILKGQIGDDAYFVARHVDDWTSEQVSSSDREVLCPTSSSDPRTCSTTSSANSGVAVETSHRFVRMSN